MFACRTNQEEYIIFVGVPRSVPSFPIPTSALLLAFSRPREVDERTEVIAGLPLNSASMRILTGMVNTACSVASLHFYRGADVNTEKVADLELSEGLPFSSFMKVGVSSASKLQIWIDSYFPMRGLNQPPVEQGAATLYLFNVNEYVHVRDAASFKAPKLALGGLTSFGTAFIHTLRHVSFLTVKVLVVCVEAISYA